MKFDLTAKLMPVFNFTLSHVLIWEKSPFFLSKVFGEQALMVRYVGLDKIGGKEAWETLGKLILRLCQKGSEDCVDSSQGPRDKKY